MTTKLYPEPASEPMVTQERRGAIAIVTFSCGPNNHFSTKMLVALSDALEAVSLDPKVHAIVLASTGRHFCAGADLIGSSEEPAELYEQAARLFAIDRPIVAAVQGAAVGGGLGLALIADFRVVAPSTRLTANFVKLGMHPGFAITYVLPRVVGHQKAAELLLTGRRIGGEEAVSIQLADRLAADEDVLSAAIGLAEAIAECAPLAVESTRRTLRSDLLDAIRRQTAREAIEQLRLRDSHDFAEGVRAVAERRPGNWTRS